MNETVTKTNEPEMLSYQIATRPERTRRIQVMLEYLESTPPGICIERARQVTQSYKENGSLPGILQRAKMDERILGNMSLYLLPGSLLVGNQASKPRWAPLFPEFAVDFLEQEILHSEPYYPSKRPADRFEVDEAILPELREIIEYWKGKTHKERVYANLPADAVLAQDSVGVVNVVNFMHGGDGHYSPDYAWLLDNGIRAIIDMSEEHLSKLDWHEPDAVEKKRFYEAVIISSRAVIDWAHRYSQLAKDQATRERNILRRKELLEIGEICEWVPENPARSFHEAVQFICLIQFALQIEDNGQGMSLGRMDRILWKYYEADLAKGLLSRDRALELIENLFIMFYTLDRIRSWQDTDYFRGKPMFQNVTIGGVDPGTKEDSTNELTYIILDTIANNRIQQPSFYVRWHSAAPERYKLKVAETIRLGIGYPAVANDELFIKNMMLRGYSERDAYDYCVISCAETGTSGLRGGRTGGSWFCLAKVLELALNNGKDPRSGVILQTNRNNRDLSGFETFDEVWESFKDQTDYYLRMHAILDNTIDKLWEEYLEEPMAAAFGCPQTTLDRGKPIKEGGAKYDFTGNETIGTANVANSLYVVKKLIFEDRLITGSQLLHALKTNFEDIATDPTGPEIQQMCLSVPKYGNDVDEVDLLARKALEYECEELPKYKNTRYGRGPIGGVFQASTTTVSSNTPFGKITGALPDGRKAWTPLADGQSPMRGTDVKGPTAAVNSVSKLRNEILSEGSLYNLKFLPNDLREIKGLKRFIAIIDHYFSRGGMQMQFNVVSRQTLLNAQKSPEKYSNLIVRVAGYSAYFTTLSKEVQRDIIERTEERL